MLKVAKLDSFLFQKKKIIGFGVSMICLRPGIAYTRSCIRASSSQFSNPTILFNTYLYINMCIKTLQFAMRHSARRLNCWAWDVCSVSVYACLHAYRLGAGHTMVTCTIEFFVLLRCSCTHYHLCCAPSHSFFFVVAVRVLLALGGYLEIYTKYA